VTPDDRIAIGARLAGARHAGFPEPELEDLLADADRLEMELRAAHVHQGAAEAEAARLRYRLVDIRAVVEALPGYLIEAAVPLASFDYSTTKRVELPNASVILTQTPMGEGFVDRAAVLAIIDKAE
jgi:hypothetical protein